MSDEREAESASPSLAVDEDADVRAHADDEPAAPGPGPGPGHGPAVADGGRAGPPLPAVVESLLFVADRPLALTEIARLLDVSKRAVEKAVEELGERCACAERGLRLQRRNGSVQMVTAPEAAETIQRFLGIEHAAPLSRPALEALSVIAYRQPITRPELDDVRGVNSDGVLRTLIARDLVEPVGRRETVGLPIEYGTTYRFLEYFGLTSLDDLPPLESTGLPAPVEAAVIGAIAELDELDNADGQESSAADDAVVMDDVFDVADGRSGGRTAVEEQAEELGQPA